MSGETKKGLIAIDAWKLPIFERRLSQAGYAFETSPGITTGTLFITVKTTNMTALYDVVKAANDEAAMTKGKS